MWRVCIIVFFPLGALQSKHQQRTEQVKNGMRVSELPAVEVDDQPDAAAAPVSPALESVKVTTFTHIKASVKCFTRQGAAVSG